MVNEEKIKCMKLRNAFQKSKLLKYIAVKRIANVIIETELIQSPDVCSS